MRPRFLFICKTPFICTGDPVWSPVKYYPTVGNGIYPTPQILIWLVEDMLCRPFRKQTTRINPLLQKRHEHHCQKSKAVEHDKCLSEKRLRVLRFFKPCTFRKVTAKGKADGDKHHSKHRKRF